MKQSLLILAALLLAAAPVFAATPKIANPPTAAQKARFLEVCLKKTEGNATLCNCKAEQAMSLIDTDFMNVVIDQMLDKPTLTKDQEKPYAIYISRSNAVCAPGM